MKAFLIIAGILLLLTLIAVGYYMWKKNPNEKDAVDPKTGAPAGAKEVSTPEGGTLTLPAGSVVQSAIYGTNTNNVDVTALISSAALAGTPIPVNNTAMGGDPAVGVVKKLTVFYTTE